MIIHLRSDIVFCHWVVPGGKSELDTEGAVKY